VCSRTDRASASSSISTYRAGTPIHVDFFNRPAGDDADGCRACDANRRQDRPLFALPLPGGRYRMIYEHAIEPPPASTEDPIHD
jgi:hypothetical protein